MNIVIRVDASVHIGSGHVMRCLVLARELRRQDHNVSFATRPQNGDSIDYIRQQNFVVHELPQPKEWLIPQSDSDYLAWLQVPVKLDADHFCSIIESIDLVVVDHYALGKQWEAEIKNYFGCKIVAIDDLVRDHNADIIVDQTLFRSSTEYSKSNTGIHLTGCDYAILNPQFTSIRECALDRDCFPKTTRILVSMGGIDKDNITIEVLKTLLLLDAEKPKVTVLLSRKSPSYKTVREFCVQHTDWIEHIEFAENMAEIMLEHTVAIGAPGTTSWERACLGLPSIIIPLAENQRAIAANLIKADAAILVEPEHIKTQLINSYKKLTKHWLEYRRNSLILCDGLGVKRVARYIANLLADNESWISLRRAQEGDIQQVYTWQCHPETRKYALINEKPTWERHQEWMKEKLKSVNDFFYIIISGDRETPVGVIRLDRIKRAEYLVSVFVSPEHFCQGIAKRALRFIDEIHQDVTLHATVLEANVASQRLFIAAKYQRISKDTFIRLPMI